MIKIIILFLIILSIFYCINKYLTIEHFEDKKNKKNVIAILTRGYDNNDKYNELIERNISIYDIFYSKLKDQQNYDIIILHEGNITLEQQKYIQAKTPQLPIQFKSIDFYKKDITNKTNNICLPNKLSMSFNDGYKNMCYFWSISFLEYFKDYNYLIRIDEDCVLNKLDSNIIDNYTRDNIYLSSGYFQGDDDKDVIVGMKDLFKKYINDNNIKTFKNDNDIKCPYTNFLIINIQYFLKNKNVIEIHNLIKESNCIWSNRWGDLPIWGYILTYLIDPIYYKEDKDISYFHGTHSKQIN